MPEIKMLDMDGIKSRVSVPDDIFRSIEDGSKKFVLLRGLDGRKVPIEVSREVYAIAVEARRAAWRLGHEKRDHLDDASLEDDWIISGAVTETLEETYLRRERWQTVCDVLENCTPVQRRRFYLNRIYGYDCVEISKMQKCNPRRIRNSVEAVSKKLKKIFER